jgi:two-component system sensor histidine kinase BaeS
MLRTLRGRYVLSHVLPLLIAIPLMGTALLYGLETQVLLVNLATEVQGQALLTARLAEGQPDIWHDPVKAQALVDNIDPDIDARVMLLAPGCRLLASSDPADRGRVGQQLQAPGCAIALEGEISVSNAYSQRLGDEIVDVLVPVLEADGQVAGIVRLSHERINVLQRFVRLRYIIVGVLLGGLLLGAVAGWVLALNMEQPLREVTETVSQLVDGRRRAPLPERGPQEIHRLITSVNSLVERLHSLEQARHQLLSNLVHELGRPLGALHSAIEALLARSGENPAVRRELLAGMDAEVDQLGRLLDDLARLHDQELGTLELSRRSVDLGEWLRHMAAPWREMAQTKGLKWEAIVPSDLPVMEVDPERLGQALGNLLSNAIKYTPRKGTVSLSAGLEKEEVWIRVSDTGRGIPLAEQERIFAPFYRSQRGRRFPQGMGLGLSIAQAMVAAHGGRIEVKSTPGLGSQFTFWLPLSNQEA